MKIKLLTSLILFSMLSINGYSQQPDNWKWLNPSPQGNSLFAMDFTDNNTGYSAGAFGTVIKTTDGGGNWTQLTSGTNTRLLSIDFVNNDLGYFGGFYQLLKKTTDGGQSWNQIQLPVEGPFDDQFSIMDIKFINENTGYVLGFFQLESKIWKTTNGGANWITQTTGGANYLNTLFFLDENNGYSAGGALGSEIIKTTDGGSNWQLVEYYENPALSDIYFFDQTKGVAAGEDGCVLVSTNSGLNWTRTGSPTSMDVSSVIFTDEQTGFGIGAGSIYIKTENGGINWTEQNFGFSSTKPFMDAQATPDGKIHAVGKYGTILLSGNGGLSWQTQYTVTEKTLSEILFVNNNTGYAVCGYSGGDILKTTDAGETWISQIEGYHTPMYGISFTDSETGYIAGSIDIQKTTNGGTNWINVYSSTTNEIFTDIVFTDPNTGYVAGSYGKLLKTTNAGQTWSTGVISTNGSMITSLCFVNENTGYAAGDFGEIAKTTNAGQTWTNQASPLQFAYLTSIDFQDENTGYVSSGSGLLKTTDGGTTWSIMNAPAGGYYKIQFRNNFGYAVASNGMIIKSTDSGNSWIEQPTVTDNGLYALYFNSDNYVYAGGLLGSILKTIPSELIVTSTENNLSEITQGFVLAQNYPNPFNPSTNLEIGISEMGFVSLKIYDISGKEISTLVNERLYPGTYKYRFEGTGLTSGVYFYTLKVNGLSQTKRMLLIK
ncbi:MAG TPA: YCF48-related protein [Ignavibacteria bacterium]|nr:YCF48-related protein [Ignavibacteria bacterium]